MIKSLFRSVIELFPTLALLLRNIRSQLDQLQASKKTPWGFNLAGNEAMASGNFEPQETNLVRDLLTHVDMLINVGANVGYYCCHSLSLGKPVIAVEPIAHNVHYLLKNIRDNGWASQAQVYPVALGTSTDILEIWGGGTGASLIKGWASIPESYVALVPVLSLDQILGNGIAGKHILILVDIEGAEFMMLQGALKTLSHNPRPIWMVEITTTEHQPAGSIMNPHFKQTFEMFFSHGYRAYMADEQQNKVTREMVEDVASGKACITTYNFLFR
jgi:FkbM family methyltransferase